MDTAEKLKILTEGAKYDVACTSSGINRKGNKNSIGSAKACGICHSFASDGRCISLLKLLMTNACIYNCGYCFNRRSNDIPRATFSPKEIVELTMDFYRRNYIEGLFLSSGVIKDPNFTMELMIETLALLREKHRFNGYIHAKAIPGADELLIRRLGHLTDRMSVNIELPSEKSLLAIAPDKNKQAILKPMRYIKEGIRQSKDEVAIFRNAPTFVPAGQSTQLIVGATKESDSAIMNLTEGLYNKFGLKRVFYSAYINTGVDLGNQQSLPTVKPPLLREHRLYQADWLLRFYGFSAQELFTEEQENLNLHLDPKCHWALGHLELFPVEINKVNYEMLLRVPGIGEKSARRIMLSRRVGKLDFSHLKKIGVVLKRAKYFITCSGKMQERVNFRPDLLEYKLMDMQQHEQISLFDSLKEEQLWISQG